MPVDVPTLENTIEVEPRSAQVDGDLCVLPENTPAPPPPSATVAPDKLSLSQVAPIALPLAPPVERRRLQAYLAMMLADAGAIVLGFMLGAKIYHAGAWSSSALVEAQVMLPIYWTTALALRVYSITAFTDISFARARTIFAIIATEMVLMFVGFATKSTDSFSRISSALGLLFAMSFLLIIRSLARPAIRRHCGATASNTLIIDDGGIPLDVPHAYHVNATEHQLDPDLSDPHRLDRIGMYLMNMDRVLVNCPPERRTAWAMVFKSANISGEIVDEQVLTLGVLGARRGPTYGSLVVSSGPLGLRARVLKRAFDTAIAGSAVVILAPLLALVAIAIKLEDRGPVLFVQNRTGRGNRFFPIYKFRSMCVEKGDAAGARSASLDDDRITRIGRFIRRTSLDELPQLFNVLAGHMSIVGPRPHAIGSLAGDKLFWEVDDRYWLRHSLKPGLTGLAQVRGLRGATDTEADLANRLQADLEYLDGWTIWRDIKILIGTASVLVHDRAF